MEREINESMKNEKKKKINKLMLIKKEFHQQIQYIE